VAQAGIHNEYTTINDNSINLIKSNFSLKKEIIFIYTYKATYKIVIIVVCIEMTF